MQCKKNKLSLGKKNTFSATAPFSFFGWERNLNSDFWNQKRDVRFGGLSESHTIIEIHHQNGFGKGLEEKMFWQTVFRSKILYHIWPFYWTVSVEAPLCRFSKENARCNRFLSLCRATSLEVKLYFWGILTTQAHQAVNSSLIIPSLCLLWKRNNRMCKSC